MHERVAQGGAGLHAAVGAIGAEAAPIRPAVSSRIRSRRLQLARAGARLLQDLRRDWQLYLLLAPMLIWFLVFLYKPMYGLQIAFKQYSLFRGVEGSPWIGFANFAALFANEYFLRALKNTLLISIYSLVDF